MSDRQELISPDWDAIRDKRMSDLTPLQKKDAHELWLRNQLGTMPEYYREHLGFLLDRLNAVRAAALATALEEAQGVALTDAVAIADAIRVRYSDAYGEKRPDWQGNVYWAKIEAAAEIVRALKDAAPVGCPHALGHDDEKICVDCDYAAPAAPTRDEQDAKRYRVIRDCARLHSSGTWVITFGDPHDGASIKLRFGLDADAAIDAALAEPKRSDPQHVCGLQGFDPTLGDDPCPACRADRIRAEPKR